MRISQRADAIQESPIRKLAPLAAATRARGISIYNLNIGQPDVATPPEFLQAVGSFKEKVLAYGPSDGLPELRAAMADYFARYAIALDPGDVLITNGGSEAILFAFNVVADDGEEIIIPEPFYTNYNGYAAMANLKIVPVRTHAEDGFHLPPDEVLEAAVTPRTRATAGVLAQQPDRYGAVVGGARAPGGVRRAPRPLPHRRRGVQGVHLRGAPAPLAARAA